MIRWRFILPRVIFVLVVLLALQLAAGPVAGWLAKVAYERSTGGRLSIVETRAGFFPPRVEFRDIQCADPRHDRENIAEFDSVFLSLDGNALLHRRWVIKNAKLTGLRFSTERETDGRIPVEPESTSDDPSRFAPAADALAAWMRTLAGEASESLLAELETVRLAKELEVQWQSTYQDEVARAARIEGSVRTIRDNFQGIDNPLRDIPRMQAAIAETERLQQDLAAAKQSISGAPGRLQADMQRLNQARQRDTQRIISHLPVDGNVENLGQLATELLTNLYTKPLATVRQYLALGTRAADMTVRGPKAVRGNGINHDLDNRAKDPFLLVKHCELAGIVSVNRDEYALAGLAEDFTIADEATPLRIRLRLSGRQEIKLDYQRYPKELWPHHLTLHVPALPPPTTTYRCGKHLTIDAAAVPLEFWAEISTNGTQLGGRLIAKQQGTSMTARVNGEGELMRSVEAAVNQSLSQVRQLEMEATLLGSWDHPQFRVTSNLEPALKNAFAAAGNEAKAVAMRKLQLAVDHTYEKQAGMLNSLVSKQQAELDKIVAQAESQVREVTSTLTAQINRSPVQLGRLQGLLNR